MSAEQWYSYNSHLLVWDCEDADVYDNICYRNPNFHKLLAAQSAQEGPSSVEIKG